MRISLVTAEGQRCPRSPSSLLSSLRAPNAQCHSHRTLAITATVSRGNEGRMHTSTTAPLPTPIPARHQGNLQIASQQIGKYEHGGTFILPSDIDMQIAIYYLIHLNPQRITVKLNALACVGLKLLRFILNDTDRDALDCIKGKGNGFILEPSIHCCNIRKTLL